ncbi:MAG: hypothetical protein EZS28_046594, partial [Streblomastix strix]
FRRVESPKISFDLTISFWISISGLIDDSLRLSIAQNQNYVFSVVIEDFTLLAGYKVVFDTCQSVTFRRETIRSDTPIVRNTAKKLKDPRPRAARPQSSHFLCSFMNLYSVKVYEFSQGCQALPYVNNYLALLTDPLEENVVSKIGKLYESSLVSVDDSQRERESRLRGVTNGLQTEDVLSKSSREKFKARKTGRAVLSRFNGQGYSFPSNYHKSFFAKKGKFDQSRQNQFKVKGNYSAKKFGKFNKNRFNNTQDEDKPSP